MASMPKRVEEDIKTEPVQDRPLSRSEYYSLLIEMTDICDEYELDFREEMGWAVRLWLSIHFRMTDKPPLVTHIEPPDNTPATMISSLIEKEKEQ